MDEKWEREVEALLHPEKGLDFSNFGIIANSPEGSVPTDFLLEEQMELDNEFFGNEDDWA